jgi:hypothetical protein
MAAILERVLDGMQERYTAGGGAGRPAIALRTLEGPLRVFGGGEPRATLVVRTRAGMTALVSMDLTAMGEAYLAGDIDVEGDLMQVLPLRETFTDHHPLRYALKFLRPLVRGQVRADGSAIPSTTTGTRTSFSPFWTGATAATPTACSPTGTSRWKTPSPASWTLRWSPWGPGRGTASWTSGAAGEP